MTQKILIGIAMTAIMAAIGIGTQHSVWAETDEQLLKESVAHTDHSDVMMLVDAPILHKGGKSTLTLVPRPQEGIDGIPLPKAAGPDMILVATPITHKGEIPIYTLVPKPAPKLADYTS